MQNQRRWLMSERVARLDSTIFISDFDFEHDQAYRHWQNEDRLAGGTEIVGVRV
jgi:hypothetical protein